MRVWIFGAVTALVVGAGCKKEKAEWTEHVHKTPGFTVALPAASPKGQQLEGMTGVVARVRDTNFFVAWKEHGGEADISETEVTRAFDALYLSLAKGKSEFGTGGGGGELVPPAPLESTPITVKGMPGRLVVYKSASASRGRVQMFRDRGRVWVYGCATDGASESTFGKLAPWCEKVIDSFARTDREFN